jgi:hypothetical protein
MEHRLGIRGRSRDVSEHRADIAFPRDVPNRQHADDPAARLDRKPSNSPLAHHPHGVADPIVGRHRRQDATANIADASLVRVEPFGQDADDDVAIGQDAMQAIIALHDEDVADVRPAHELGRRRHRLVGIQGLRSGAHNVANVLMHWESFVAPWAYWTNVALARRDENM